MGTGVVAAHLVLTAVSHAAPGAVPALYATREEAEKAAKLHFHCSGAHKMGNQWMPCANHGTPPHSEHGGSKP